MRIVYLSRTSDSVLKGEHLKDRFRKIRFYDYLTTELETKNDEVKRNETTRKGHNRDSNCIQKHWGKFYI